MRLTRLKLVGISKKFVMKMLRLLAKTKGESAVGDYQRFAIGKPEQELLEKTPLILLAREATQRCPQGFEFE